MLKFNFVGKVKLEFVNDGNTKTSKLQSCLFELDPSPNLKRAIYLNPDGAPTEEGMKRLRDTLIHGLVALTSYAKDKNWLTMEEGFVFIGQSVKKGLEDYERIGTTFAVDESIDAPPEQKNFKSTDKELVEELERRNEYGKYDKLIALARAKHFHDFKAPAEASATPKADLLRWLNGFPELDVIRIAVMNGEYDEAPDEQDTAELAKLLFPNVKKKD